MTTTNPPSSPSLSSISLTFGTSLLRSNSTKVLGISAVCCRTQLFSLSHQSSPPFALYNPLSSCLRVAVPCVFALALSYIYRQSPRLGARTTVVPTLSHLSTVIMTIAYPTPAHPHHHAGVVAFPSKEDVLKKDSLEPITVRAFLCSVRCI